MIDPLAAMLESEDFMATIEEEEGDKVVPVSTALQSTGSSASRSEKDIDIGFLFASPVVLENEVPGQGIELVEFPKINWKQELKMIKDEAKRRELQVKIEA